MSAVVALRSAVKAYALCPPRLALAVLAKAAASLDLFSVSGPGRTGLRTVSV
jgi:hypothetical protein